MWNESGPERADAAAGLTILVGEDDPEVRRYLDLALKRQGYSVSLAEDGDEVLERLRANDPPVSAILLDLIMPRKDGLETLREIRRVNREIPVIVLSGDSDPSRLEEAVGEGANAFLGKPVDPADLRSALRTALETEAPAEGRMPGPDVRQPGGAQIFFGTTPQMRRLQNLLGQIAWSEAPVLIRGETGAGKEVIARELHARSPRAKRAFLKLNCAALPSELVESELFGYDRGAFTGAFQRKPGMFEMADGGTILLDEIGDMDFKLQAKLLQVLQDHEFQRLGGKDTVKVDVRVIAATHRDLRRAIAEQSFREDLYYRLDVINIEVPPLRERRPDILPLAEHLLRKHGGPGLSGIRIPPQLREALLDHDWPGNIRELENVVRKFLIFRDSELIEADLRANGRPRPSGPSTQAPAAPPAEGERAWPSAAALAPPAAPQEAALPILEQVTEAKRHAERTAILAALEAGNWNRRHAARILKIDYKALLYKMKKLSIGKEKRQAPARKPAPAPAQGSACSAAD